MLKDRQKSILEAAILEHIRTARPVASQEIMECLRLGVSPATIRSEMQTLDEEGYLEQPHTSAGRVPTDKGYRFFVDNVIEQSMLEKGEKRKMDEVFNAKEVDEFIKYLSRSVAEISGVFAAVGAFDDDVFYDNGLAEILDEPEFKEASSIRAFSRLVDLLDETIPELFRAHDIEEEAMFIGSENPLHEARDYAMTVSRWHHPEGFEGFVAMVGPKRTHYEKHMAIVRYLEKIR
ncbi:MAG: DeoR family transcriptional regulator [Candidatus Sungbacteria bacterium]|nr:DeoR family transcriptional regulator [Candidatus Sungbacteria bacterium]